MNSKRTIPLDRFARDQPTGPQEWIGPRPARREPLVAVEDVLTLQDLRPGGEPPGL